MSGDTIRMSVVLPAYNEGGTITEVIRRCREAVPDLAEVLVVDDGSTDATAALAEQAKARVIRLDRNRGKGHALRVGIEAAVGDVLIFLDADGQDDPGEIPLLLEAIADGADVVVGSRFLGRFEAGAITTINRYGTHALNGIVNLLFGVRLTDTQAGFRAVRRSLLDRVTLRAQRYDIETDLLLQALQVGGRVVEVPVRRGARYQGTSNLYPPIDGLRILGRILRLRFQRAAEPGSQARF
jgi:glycosyltransferase involved in cell wall biosynthesis